MTVTFQKGCHIIFITSLSSQAPSAKVALVSIHMAPLTNRGGTHIFPSKIPWLHSLKEKNEVVYRPKGMVNPGVLILRD